MSPVIELRGLSVRYGGREILNDVNLTVERGEFVTVVGRSGGGKSTMLNALAGFIDKEGYSSIPSNFGFIFQSFAVFPWLTVSGNILFGMPRDLASHQRALRLQSLLDMTGLTEEANNYPAELSGGQTQRVALARALARDPEVLLMDEPFGSLDIYTREKMQTWLLQIWELQQQAIIFVTHSIEEALFLSDRILVLANGRIQCSFQVPFSRPRANSLKYEPGFIELNKEIASIMEAS
jgi:ABC-type nitrate/sulfonate/bicarbonate transport system ATPase subunit